MQIYYISRHSALYSFRAHSIIGPLFLSIQPSLYYQAPVVDDINTVMEIIHQADEESGPLIRIEVIHILGQGHYAGGGITCIWS